MVHFMADRRLALTLRLYEYCFEEHMHPTKCSTSRRLRDNTLIFLGKDKKEAREAEWCGSELSFVEIGWPSSGLI